MALVVATVAGAGVYLLLESRTFPVILGLLLLSYAVNVLLFASGGLTSRFPPLLGADGAATGAMADPLPQAFVLTAIVIGFAMTGFLLALAIRARVVSGNDRVDVGEGE